MDIPAAPQSRMLTLDASVLQSTIFTNPDILNELPFLRYAAGQAQNAGAGCNTCGGASTKIDYNGILQLLATMDISYQRALLRLTNAQRIKIYYADATGKVQKVLLQP